MEKFCEMQYVRPDGEALLQKIREATMQLRDSGDFETAKTIFWSVQEEATHFETMSSLAYVRNTINTKDAFYEKEMEYLFGIQPRLNVEMKAFHEVLLASAFLADFEKELGELYVQQIKADIRLTDACNVELQVKESMLKQEYSKTAAAPTTQFHGEELNFYGLLKKMQSDDRLIRKEAMEAWAALYESISEKLDSIYTELMKLRLQMAENLGFSSYEEMVFLKMGRYTYTPEDLAVFRRQVCEHVVPICEKLFENQRQRLGIDTLHYYDESIVFPDGNAMPIGTTQELLEKAGNMYREISKETGDFFDFMLAYDLFDLETRNGKQQGGYCTTFPDYKAPFIFSNFNGTDADIDVLTHEAGHSFEAYEAMRRIPLTEQTFSTSEVAEIHSMSMEFFTYPWMELFFGEHAEKYRKSHLWDALECVPYMACVDEFQHRVYEEKLFDAMERRKIWSELEKKYMPWRDYDGNAFLENGGFWMQKQHIFMEPFYYIDYALARFGSLEYYGHMMQDYQSAWEDYYHLCCAGGSRSYPELLKIGNLSSPLEEGTVKKILDSIEEYI